MEDIAAAWGHRAGLIELKPRRLRSMDLRGELYDVLARLAWSMDERRLDVLADCFTAGASFAVVNSDGSNVQIDGIDAIVRWLEESFNKSSDQRRHAIVNMIIDELGDQTAHVLAYLLVFGNTTTGAVIKTTGWYKARFTRDGDWWRISSIVVGSDLSGYRPAQDRSAAF